MSEHFAKPFAQTLTEFWMIKPSFDDRFNPSKRITDIASTDC
jgi:hypothetical protein